MLLLCDIFHVLFQEKQIFHFPKSTIRFINQTEQRTKHMRSKETHTRKIASELFIVVLERSTSFHCFPVVEILIKNTLPFCRVYTETH